MMTIIFKRHPNKVLNVNAAEYCASNNFLRTHQHLISIELRYYRFYSYNHLSPPGSVCFIHQKPKAHWYVTFGTERLTCFIVQISPGSISITNRESTHEWCRCSGSCACLVSATRIDWHRSAQPVVFTRPYRAFSCISTFIHTKFSFTSQGKVETKVAPEYFKIPSRIPLAK